MKMANKEELKQILKELRTQSDLAQVKAKAAEFLRNVDPQTLSLAEQGLMHEGISPEELRRLYGVHLTPVIPEHLPYRLSICWMPLLVSGSSSVKGSVYDVGVEKSSSGTRS